MISDDLHKRIESTVRPVCESFGFDIAILYVVEGSALRVAGTYLDPFARPDLNIGVRVDAPGDIYQNEFHILNTDADVSFIPTPAMGADCGFRIAGTDYLIVFDDVFSGDDDDIDDDGRAQLTQLKTDLEQLLNG